MITMLMKPPLPYCSALARACKSGWKGECVSEEGRMCVSAPASPLLRPASALGHTCPVSGPIVSGLEVETVEVVLSISTSCNALSTAFPSSSGCFLTLRSDSTFAQACRGQCRTRYCASNKRKFAKNTKRRQTVRKSNPLHSF